MDYKEQFSKIREITAHYTETLQSHGYHDVDVKIPVTLTCPKEINAYFWDGEYGYSLEIRCSSEDLNPESIVLTCNEIVEFVSDPISLRLSDISKEFSHFLTSKSFHDIRLVSWSNSNLAYLTAFKGSIKYTISLNRKLAEERKIDFSEENDPVEFSANEIALYGKKFDCLFQQTLRITEYQIDLSADLEAIHAIICRNWDKYHLEIQCDTNLTWGLEDLFCDVICCWIDSINNPDRFLQYLQKNNFYLPNNLVNKNSFICYREGYSFEIKTHSEKVIDFDHMEGHAFESFCAEVLSLNGFEKVHITRGSGDQGIDIIAYKNDIKYGIQCKCYSTDIGNKAVQEVCAGQIYYDCDVGVVLTNRHFTKSAIELAKRSRVRLWDRGKLLEMVDKCRERLLGQYGK